ncbi:zgc:158868 [Hoplias malabaricus]|uniref:zgc:158868 n=1 Tax=Hoplias malabaricus TaxID=27720 RepID=UPI003462E90D
MSSRICDSVLVTGSNRGIGLELIHQLVESPSRPEQIFATCRDPEGPRAQELRELAQKHKDVIVIVQLDTTDPASISQAAKTVGSKLKDGSLNLIINNAGVNVHLELCSTQEKDMVDTYRTNVVGPMFVAKEFLPYLRKAASQFHNQTDMSCRRAAVINVSTLVSSIQRCPENFARAPMYAYRISKAALNMLTRCLAEEFRKDGILVMAIHPGWVKTDMGGQKAPVLPEDSVKGMLKVISSLTEKDSGTLLDIEGHSIPW